MTDQPKSTDALDPQLEQEVANALGDQSLEDLMQAEQQANTPAPSPEANSTEADADSHDDNAQTTNTRIGTIAAVRGDDVFITLGGKEQGVCALSNFKKTPRVGDHMEFLVEGYDQADSLYRLLLPGNTTKADWKSIAQGMVIEAVVTGINTGGLELKVAGKKAFMPASHVELHHVEDFTPYLQKKLRCKVVELDKRKRRILLSRRAILQEEQEVAKAHLVETFQPGQKVEGIVRRIEKFGAFVEIQPGIDGLVHVSDLAWSHVDDPKTVVSVDQKVTVEILKIKEGGKISLGLKQTQANPWDNVGQTYPVGSKVKGTVTRTTEFGAFLELEPGVEGLIHISQLSTDRINRVQQVARPGQELEAQVMQFDPDRKRLSLSIKALTAKPEDQRANENASRDDMKKYVKSEKQAKATESLADLLAQAMNKGG